MNAVDTNVLVYAHDPRDPVKQNKAVSLIAQNLMIEKKGFLSIVDFCPFAKTSLVSAHASVSWRIPVSRHH